MATVKNNLVTTGFAGKIGNLVFRQRGGKTTVYTLSPRTKPLSELQLEAQRNFADAVKKAKLELSTPEGRNRFEELAKKQKKGSAYGAAISYFCKEIMNREDRG